MDSNRMGVLIVAAMLCLARGIDAVALSGDCSAGATSCDAGLVCEPADTTCRVKADGTSTDCASTNGNCPANATCNTNTCSCNQGFVVVATGTTAGLCVVTLGNDCSGAGDTCATGLVCEAIAGGTTLCKVKADGSATNCSSTNTNCPSNALCYTDVCKCSIGYKVSADLCVEATCTSASDCTSSITNSMCEITYPCSKGICACKSGYSGDDCESLVYQKTCDPSDDKCDGDLNLECPSGGTKCDCTSGNSYKSALGRCTSAKLLGESCTGAGTGDCYTTLNSECSSTCKCLSGYYQDGQVCRQPYGGETCTQGDTCAKVPDMSILAAGESSQKAPTCTSSICDCGSYEKVKRKIGSTCYTVCLSSGTGKTAVGQTCKDFRECASRVCAQCPDDANPKCYNAPCSGSTISGSILVSSIILLSILF